MKYCLLFVFIFSSYALYGESLKEGIDLEKFEHGRALYENPTYCVTCHGKEGMGIPKVFPPLVQTEWVVGNPNLLVRTIHSGLEGKVTVKGEDYDALMPAHGAYFTDEEMEELIYYVRNAWGNRGSDVDLSVIKSIRKDEATRDKAWKAKDLLKSYGGNNKVLFNLAYKAYSGEWESMPDFSALTPKWTKKLASNFKVELKNLSFRNIAVVFAGSILIEEAGEYAFQVTADNIGRLTVDGNVVVDFDNSIEGSDTEGTVHLTQGEHSIEFAYLQKKGDANYNVNYKMNQPGKRWINLGRNSYTSSLLKAEGERAAIYRNFVDVGGNRAIAVAYPGNLNLAFDANISNMTSIWVEDFIDAGIHRNGRGQGRARPAGKSVRKLPQQIPFAILENPSTAWPEVGDKSKRSQFKGYLLDKKGYPTFGYNLESKNSIYTILDQPIPVSSDEPHFLRRFELKPKPTISDNIYYLAASAKSIQEIAPGQYQYDDVVVSFPDIAKQAITLRKRNGQAELIIDVRRLADGGNEPRVVWTQKYAWVN